jgi:hypothetical protein
MNSSADDIKDLLLAESSFDLEHKVNLFVGREPSSPDNCVILFDTPGYSPALTLGNDTDFTDLLYKFVYEINLILLVMT